MNSEGAALFLTVEPMTPMDGSRLHEGLRKLKAPVELDARTGRTILRGTNEAELEQLVEQLRSEFRVVVAAGAPRVAYRKRLTREAEGEGRYDSPSGEFAQVRLRIEPGEAGAGYVFENRASRDDVPEEFVVSIEEGIREALRAEYPIEAARVELCGGAFHSRDSSVKALQEAAAVAVRDAVRKAGPVVLEPVVRLRVAARVGAMAEVIADIARRRGEIVATEEAGVAARVPLAQMLGYGSDLRELTNGSGTWTMEFDRYEPRPIGPEDDEDRVAPITAKVGGGPGGRHGAVALPEPDEMDWCA